MDVYPNIFRNKGSHFMKPPLDYDYASLSHCPPHKDSIYHEIPNSSLEHSWCPSDDETNISQYLQRMTLEDRIVHAHMIEMGWADESGPTPHWERLMAMGRADETGPIPRTADPLPRVGDSTQDFLQASQPH